MGLLLLASCASQEVTVSIPASETVEVEAPDFTHYQAYIKNKSMKDLEVKVMDENTEEFRSGFGLGMKGKADIYISEGGKLMLSNPHDKDISVKVEFEERGAPEAYAMDPDESVTFTLRNNGAQSIPLIIPGVMNPNLSPMSNSGVDLAYGQEIIFKEKGKKYVLLVVDDNIEDGEVLDVGALIKEKKKELGI